MEFIHRKLPLMTVLLIVIILSLLLFLVGLMVGYGILHSPIEVLNPGTWTHILKLTGAA
ncbi:DNA-directed RNA polymerase subunit beta [Macrococcus equipercicus]|nr:DNA-directed RNA polymerase subunit beta [Macrococcus equipercicus]